MTGIGGSACSKASTRAASSFQLATSGSGEIRGAVNAGGIKLDLPPDEAPLLQLAGRIGALLAGFTEGGYKTITLRASGQRAQKHMATLLRLATVELLKPHLDTPVNVINVEHIARQRGIELVQISEPQPPAGLVGDIIGVFSLGERARMQRMAVTAQIRDQDLTLPAIETLQHRFPYVAVGAEAMKQQQRRIAVPDPTDVQRDAHLPVNFGLRFS